MTERQRQLNMFLRSVTQPTLSTMTGCTANRAAASHAPGTLQSGKQSPYNSTLATCSTMFTR